MLLINKGLWVAENGAFLLARVKSGKGSRKRLHLRLEGWASFGWMEMETGGRLEFVARATKTGRWPCLGCVLVECDWISG